MSAHQNRLLNFCQDYDQKSEQKKPSRKDYLLYSYEEDELSDIFNDDFEMNHDLWLGKSAKRYDVIIMRDPFNLFASRLKWLENPYKNYVGKIPLTNEENIKKLVLLWKDYAKEYLNQTQYLKNNKITINYNQWFADKAYRRKIAQAMNLKFTDDKINELAVFSTFKEDDNQKNAQELGVLERWKKFKSDKKYLKIFKDEELIDLSIKIFGDIPGTEQIYKN